MKKQFLVLIIFLSILNNLKSQYFTPTQISTIHTSKASYEGNMYLDTINKKYYIGLTNGKLGDLSNKMDSSAFINDSSLVLYWNFKDSDTLLFTSNIGSSEWEFDEDKGLSMKRATISNPLTDDSVAFVTHGRLIIADSIRQNTVYQNANGSTQIFLANLNPTRDVPRQISISNANTVGNRAYSLFTTTTDSSVMYVGSHGSSRTLNRLGLPVSKSSEVVAIKGELHLGTKESKSVYIGTNDLTRAIVTAAGDMGVNTTTPRAKLEIKGDLIEGRDTSDYGNAAFYGSCEVSHGIATYFTNDNNSTDYFHIRMPYIVNVDAKMYHIHVTGYAYGPGHVIDLTYVGYVYAPTTALLMTQIINNGEPSITTTQYIGSDNHLYLRFKTSNVYYNSFRVDSMRVGNGRVLQKEDVQIIKSSSLTL